MATITFTGTGGIIEGNLGPAAVNVNLEPALQFGLDASGDIGAVHKITQTGFTHHNRDISFSCWFRAAAPWTTSPSKTALFSMVNGSETYRTLWVGIEGTDDNPRFRGYIGDGSSYDGFEHVIITDEEVEKWNHYAITISSGNTNTYTVKTYINGVLRATDTTHSQNYDSTARAPQVGDSGYTNLDGYLKDWRCYGTELDIDDIKILASKMNVNNALLANSAELQLHYKLDGTDISSTTVTNAGNASSSNGTLNSTTGIVTHYDEFSVNVQDNSTTTNGNFTVTQGKVEGKALSYLTFVAGNSDYAVTSDDTVIIDDVDSTIAFWYKGASPGTGTIAESRATSNDAAIYSRLGTELRYYTNGSGEFGLDASEVTACGLYDDKWHHVAFVLDHGGALADQRVYVDGVSRTLTAITTVSSLDVTWRGFKVGGQLGHINAELRDIKVFDYPLSADQASSLCSNTYPQTPKHYWKFDEGTGNAVDSGTGTSQDMTINGPDRVDGTLDLDGTLTIQANGTLSAPRDNLTIAGGGDAFDNNGTDPTTSFEHNDGTVTIDGGNMALRGGASTTGTHFYNLTQDGSGYIDGYERYTVENKLTTKAGVSYYMNGDNYIYIGKAGVRAGEFEINGAMNFTTNGRCYIEGAGGPTLPALIDYNGSHSGASGNTGADTAYVHLTNTNWDGTLTTGTTNFKLLGDAEFDAVTVSSGGELDLNSQRAEFGGNFSLTGTLSDTGNAGIAIFKGTYTRSGTKADLNTGTVFMIEGAGSSDYHDPVPDKFFVNAGSGTVTLGNPLEVAGSGTADVILGSGTINANNQNITGRDDITIATGGTYTAGSGTITCKGDFTTSGGLIGKSAFEGNGTDTIITLDSEIASDATSTVEFWINADATGWDAVLGGTSNNQAYFYYQNGIIIGHAGGYTYLSTGVSATSLNKWHHFAITHSGGTATLYIDGKKTDTGAVATPPTVKFIGADTASDAERFDGTMARASVWNVALTEGQIRNLLFKDWTAMAADNYDASSNPNGFNDAECIGWWQFDEGTGTDVADSSASGNDGTMGSAAWAGAGTFTKGTSTLVMSSDGAAMNLYANDTDVYNLTINGNTTVNAYHHSGTNAFKLFNNFTVASSKTLTFTGQIGLYNSGATFSFATPATNVVNVGSFGTKVSGTYTIPEVTINKMFLDTSGSNVVASGNHTYNTELEVNSGTTFNANGNTISCAFLDVDGGTVDLRNSTYTGRTGGSFNRFDFLHGGTLLTGNTTVTGTASPLTMFYLPASGNYEIVGDVSNVRMRDSGDLTVIGSVTNFTLDDSTNNIRQWHHTLDTQQLLDADENGDDDLRLTKPALDNALELMTK